MKKKDLLLLYRIILGGGILFSLYLVVNDILSPGYCPRLWIVPACYPILFYFLLPFLLSFLEITLEKVVAYICLGAGILTALNFTVRKLLSIGSCPEILSIPLCFAALITFSVLLYLRIRIKKIEIHYV